MINRNAPAAAGVRLLGRSLAALLTIGGTFVINAFVTAYATGGTASYAIRATVLAGLLAINAGLYFASFALLTAKAVGPRGGPANARSVQRADQPAARHGDAMRPWPVD